ncbi:unnamed protein product [Rhizophagus irregularis]|nr:unnamed protein product [Rhizophagus irregularis]
MFDENIDAEKEEAFNEFIKEYEEREEDWTIYDNDWHDWDDLFFYPVLIELPYYPLELRSEIWDPSRTWPDGIYWSVRVQPTFRKKLSRKITQNKENKMSTSADNDIISLNFRYRNAGNKNVIFVIEISKDKTVSDLEEEVRKKLGAINRNDFLRQIYPEEKPMRTEDRIFSYFNETPDDEDQAYPCYCKIAPSQLGRGVVVYSATHNIFYGLRYLEDHY